MREYECGSSTILVKDSWDELTELEFRSLLYRIAEYSNGEISVADMRLLWICDCLGIDLKKIPHKKQRQASDNLYTISRNVSFFLKIEYEQGKLDAVSATVRKMAEKIAPDDMPYSTEVAFLRRLPYEYKVDAVFCKNLIPTIQNHAGYTASFSDGVLDTSITALQFIEASDLLRKVNDGNADMLPVLAAVLYGNNIANKNAFKDVSTDILQAVAFNFQSFLAFLFTKTEFSIMWNNSTDANAADPSIIRLTGTDNLYKLCSEGYGTPEQVENMPLLKYLRIVKNNLISSVLMLRDYGSDDVEIAKKTGLPTEIITRIR